ncbi:hypothetical protein KCU85_g1147, partial [Aureobasidium melanogenum]
MAARCSTEQSKDEKLQDQYISTSRGGIQSLFTIDRTFKSYSFSTVKFIDVVWDLCVARGNQFFAGWVSYAAVTRAVVRAMESGPMPYDIFIRLALNGSKVSAICSTVTNLYRCRPLRITVLLGSIMLSIVYVVLLPTLLSAATGYVASTATFFTLPETDQLVPLSAVSSSDYKFRVGNGSEEYCLGVDAHDDKAWLFRSQSLNQMLCCKPLNCSRSFNEKPMSDKSWDQFCSTRDYYEVTWKGSQCAFESNGTFSWTDANDTSRKSSWNAGHARYEWGFSTVLMSLVLISHCVWSLFMLGLWLDAELNGTLQRERGFKLSQVRAALVVAEAATRTTGRSLVDLICFTPKEIRQRLGRKDATIPFEVLRQEPNIFLANLSPNPDDAVSASSLLQIQTALQHSDSSCDEENADEVRGSADLTEGSVLSNIHS